MRRMREAWHAFVARMRQLFTPADGQSTQPADIQPMGPADGMQEKPADAQPVRPSDVQREKPSDERPSRQDSYRADAIRFNRQFLSRHYDLRYNILKRTTEYRRKASADAWQPVTDRVLNRMTVEQLLEGGSSWSYGMKLLIESDFVEDYNPVGDFLDTCPQWDGHDHIGDLARRVPTDYKEWPQLFRRWLLAMVAQARGLSRDHGNALVPLLIGPQGTHKSTFCRLLLPPPLRDYYMDDIKVDNAEQVERVLGRMWLVNIDEYNAKTVREQAKIKRLLTEKDVQVRRMRSDQYLLTQRLASFIATTNERQPLTDTTGNRRYLCVEVSGLIDTDTPIDYGQLYAQALHALEQGERYWLTQDEEQALEEHNRPYLATTAADELLADHFEPAEVSRQTLVTATELLDTLRRELRAADVPTMRQLTTWLKDHGFRYGAQQGRHGWYVRLCQRADGYQKSLPPTGGEVGGGIPHRGEVGGGIPQ